MTRIFHIAIFLVLLPISLWADTWGPPQSMTYVSEDSNMIVRVEPGESNAEGNLSRTAYCRFFRYSVENKTYDLWRTHDLINEILPSRVLIPNDGSFLVTFDDYMGIGTTENTVVVYNSSGQMLKKWTLNDILSQAEIDKLPHSTMSIHWRSDVGVMVESQQEIYISPPTSYFQSDKNKKYKGFMLDLKALTIREEESLTLYEPDVEDSSIWKWIAFSLTGILVLGSTWVFVVRRSP